MTKNLLTAYGAVYLLQGLLFLVAPGVPAEGALDLGAGNVEFSLAQYQVMGFGFFSLGLLAMLLRDVQGSLEGRVLNGYAVIAVGLLALSAYHLFVKDIGVPVPAFVIIVAFAVLFAGAAFKHARTTSA